MTSEGSVGVDADGGEPGTVRPGGRTARVREAVLRAAGDALVEHGFDGLDLADVARRAEVGKTTVYRRWSAPAGLVADLLSDMAEQSLPRADTGSLAGDLRANARLVVRTLTDPRQGPLFVAVIAAATCDPRAADALHRFYAVRIEVVRLCRGGGRPRRAARRYGPGRGDRGGVGAPVLPAAGQRGAAGRGGGGSGRRRRGRRRAGRSVRTVRGRGRPWRRPASRLPDACR